MKDGLRACIELRSTLFVDLKFQYNLKNCFVKVGLAPTVTGEFRKYYANEKGTLASLKRKRKGDFEYDDAPKALSSADYSLGATLLNTYTRAEALREGY